MCAAPDNLSLKRLHFARFLFISDRHLGLYLLLAPLSEEWRALQQFVSD